MPVRIVSAILLTELLLLAPDFLVLGGSRGAINWAFMESLSKPEQPSLWWFFSSDLSSSVRFDVFLVVLYFFCVFLAALSALSVFPFWTTLTAWVTYNLFKNSVQLTYGVHELLNIALFYSLLTHATYRFNSFVKFDRSSHILQFALRIHLAIIYMSSGLEKATGEQWWTGEAIWRALLREKPSGYSLFSFEWLSEAGLLLQGLSISVLIIEIFYPLFANLTKFRKYYLSIILIMHIGIAICLGLWMFSATMIALNYLAYFSNIGSSIRIPDKLTQLTRRGRATPIKQSVDI